MKTKRNYRSTVISIFSGAWFIVCFSPAYAQTCGMAKVSSTFETRVKPRVIATTDGEVDDRSSMIRFLMYSCDFDVVGIVQVNSKYQKSGHSKDKWVEAELNQYALMLPKLKSHIRHNPGAQYPDSNYLRSIVRVGNENSADLNIAPPNMATKNTAGEQLIIATLLDSDPRPVHVLSWGGANTTASALWRLKYSGDYSTEQFNYAVSRIRIYCIWYQDGGGQWIEDNVKEAYINEAYRWDNVWDYESYDNARPGKLSANPLDVQEYMKPAWLNANVKTGHGALGAMTPQSYISEGDTPSFLHLINNGLEAHTDYTLGGWGGRTIVDPSDSVNNPNHYTDATITDDGNRNKMYWRWVIAAQNNFAARMDWCVDSTYSSANHQPIARIVGDNIRTVSPGQTITLDASPTTDPDGNILTYKWWQYYDADNCTTKITISNDSSISGASFIVPDEIGKQAHIFLEVTDNGNPPLKGYQRIIFNIENPSAVNEQGSLHPRVTALHQNYPNPFNPTTTISYRLSQNCYTTLKIFDIYGREVAEVTAGMRSAGMYREQFNASRLASGVYFAQLHAGPFRRSIKLVVTK